MIKSCTDLENPSARRSEAGFTVQELLIVLAIVGASLAIAAPNLARLGSNYRLDGAARNIAAELQRTRFRAIAELVRFRITFGTTSLTRCAEGNVNVFDVDCRTIPYDVDNGNSLTATSGSGVVVTFDTRGFISPTSGVTLIIANNQSATKTVQLTRIGAVTVS